MDGIEEKKRFLREAIGMVRTNGSLPFDTDKFVDEIAEQARREERERGKQNYVPCPKCKGATLNIYIDDEGRETNYDCEECGTTGIVLFEEMVSYLKGLKDKEEKIDVNNLPY